MRKLILTLFVSLLAFVGSASMSSAGNGGFFQILTLSAIGGAEFPESEGWIQKKANPAAVTYVCKYPDLEICKFDVFTTKFGRSDRECSEGAEVSVIGNVLVIPADCSDPII